MPQSRATLATPTVHSWADKVTTSAAVEEAANDGSGVTAGVWPGRAVQKAVQEATDDEARRCQRGARPRHVNHGRAGASLRLDPATAVKEVPG